jgi:RNA polymerase sigma-70 factor, ECF subfamily
MSNSISQPLLSASLTGAGNRTAATGSSAVAQLTRRLAAGEEEAFREFHAQYFDRLHQFLLGVTHGNEDAAREALQETLLRLIRYARPFDDEDTFWCWLKRVGRSAALDQGRQRSRYQALLDRFSLRWRGQPAPGPEPIEPDWQTLLAESLNELEATDRRLIKGKHLEGATVKELGVEAGLTEKAVESRLVRLRRQLRDRLLHKLNH